LIRLTYQPLWWDEGWSFYFAANDLGSILELTAVDIHPPLYYLLLKIWTTIFGSSAFSARFLSVVVGTATVPLLYATGRRLMGEKAGLLAAFLLAISPFHVYYSQEVRMYVLVTLLGLAAFYFALRWNAGSGQSGRLGIGLGYVVAAGAALYTQYYSVFLLLALNITVLIRWWRSRVSMRQTAEHGPSSTTRQPARALLSWLGAQLAVAVLFLPWIWYAGEKLLTYVRFKVGIEQDPSLGFTTYVARHLAAFDWGHAEGHLAEWWWVGLLPLLLLLLAFIPPLWLQARQRGMESEIPEKGKVLGNWGTWAWPLTIVAVALACGFAVNLVAPFNPPRSERLLLFALPAYLLAFAGAVRVLWHSRRSLAAVPLTSFLILAVLSLAVFYTWPRYAEDDYRPLIARVRALGLTSDAVIAVHPWQVGYFQAYIPDDKERPTLVLTPREVIPYERQLWADDPSLMAAELEALLAEHGRLWLVDHRSMGRVLEARIEAYLASNAYPALSEWYGENTTLALFTAGDPADRPVSAQFGGWLALNSAALEPGPLESAWGVVPVDLTWQLSKRPDKDYHVSLRLTDASGRVWAQRDSTPGGGLQHFSEWPVGEPQLDRHGLLVPAGTPPGDYTLTLQVYRSQDIAVLPVAFEGGGGGEVTVGTVHIVRPGTPPPVEALPISQPLVVDFGDRLRFLGSSVRSEPVLLPGQAAEVDLFWQALVDPAEDFLPRLQLLDGDGKSAAALVEKPVAGTYPTAWWRTGELVRDPHALPIQAGVRPGRYRLTLSLIRAADGTPVEIEGGQTMVDLAEVEVQDRGHSYTPTAPSHTQVAPLDSYVELTGYDMQEATQAPGSALEVTLHWHTLETPDKNYHAFVHLLDGNGEIVAQHDGPPGEGKLPTLGWLPGEYLTDTHLLQLPSDLPDGEYRLGVGLYDPTTGLRLGERIILSKPVLVATR
jgi:4-amino-4-deoxy-L-arabinose transferase-like glycosyltransferase